MEPSYFLAQCAQSGFQLPQTKSIKDIETISIIAMMEGFTFHKNGGILIGYDYSCSKNEGCLGKWMSLDGVIELNKVASEINSKLGKDFIGVKGNEALVFSNGVLRTVSFKASHVNSIPCMTNQEILATKLTCVQTFSDLESFNAHIV